ncbi:hypothetical protein EGM51_03015 [Verrucomicrobia bacterium S94]|nr:hypothetical protein EGM51_03015 [Verrucomicrobia bacterium S94]
MISFSTAIFFDAFLHLEIYVLAALVLYYVLRKQADGLFRIKYMKVVYVILMVFIAHTSLGKFSWSPWPLTLVLLLALSVALILAFFEVQPREAAVASGILVIICMVGVTSVSTVYSLIFPKSPTFSQYIGLDSLFKEITVRNRSVADFDPEQETVVSEALLVQHNVFELLDVSVEDLNAMLRTRQEKTAASRVLRERMAVAMARSGFAVRRDLLKAILSADPQQTILMASFFAGVQQEPGGADLMQHVPELLQQSIENVDGFPLTDDQQRRLLDYIECIHTEGISSTIRHARTDDGLRSGDAGFYGSVLAALVQAEFDIPMDRLITDSLARAMLSPSSLKGMASSHWKRLGKDPQLEWELALSEAEPEADKTHNEPAEVVVEENLYIRVTTSMGVVMIPDDIDSCDAWIAAANQLKIRGFVSLDDEVVILSTTGEIVRKGQQWYIEFQDFTYTFDITRIERNRVYMTAGERIENSVAVFN